MLMTTQGGGGGVYKLNSKMCLNRNSNFEQNILRLHANFQRHAFIYLHWNGLCRIHLITREY